MTYEVIKDYQRTEEPKFSLKKGTIATDQMLAEIFHKNQISRHGDKASFIAQIAKYGGVIARNLIKDGILKKLEEKKPERLEAVEEPHVHAYLRNK